jgi:hypothetical protein
MQAGLFMPEASIVLKQQMPYRQHCIKHTPDRQQHKDIFPGSHPLNKSSTKRGVRSGCFDEKDIRRSGSLARFP